MDSDVGTPGYLKIGENVAEAVTCNETASTPEVQLPVVQSIAAPIVPPLSHWHTYALIIVIVPLGPEL